MTDIPENIITLQVAPAHAGENLDNARPEPLESATLPVPELGREEALVQIAGCSICRRNLSRLGDGGNCGPSMGARRVPPCDIAGTVVAGEPAWVGREVMIAAFASEHYHGFSSHVPVSTRDLLEIKNRRAFPPLAHLSAAVDALAAPFQAAVRAGIAPGDNVVVLGLGADGPFLVQMAKAFGADTVVAVDTSEARLNAISRYGADRGVNARTRDPQNVTAEIKRILDHSGRKSLAWKVLIASGCEVELRTIIDLAGRPDTRAMVGTAGQERKGTLDKLAAIGVEFVESCSCPPEDYPGLVDRVTAGTIALSPFLLTRPMSWAKQALSPAHETTPNWRIVFTPDDLDFENSLEARSCR